MVEDRLKELGITLPQAPPRGGNYTPLKYFFGDRLVYCSGFGCHTDDYRITGKVGGTVTKEQGYWEYCKNACTGCIRKRFL